MKYKKICPTCEAGLDKATVVQEVCVNFCYEIDIFDCKNEDEIEDLLLKDHPIDENEAIQAVRETSELVDLYVECPYCGSLLEKGE